MKILITGGSGRLGKGIMQNLNNLLSLEDQVFLLQNRTPLSLEQHRRKMNIVTSLDASNRYDFAFHLAGNIHTARGTDPSHYKEFINDNVELTRKVCDVSGRVVFTSSDNVFSGMDNRDYKENDNPNPLPNYYGVTKAQAEEIVLGKNGSVVRVQSIVGLPSNLIIDKIFAAIEGKPYSPFWNDQFLRPTFFDDILSVFKKVYEGNRKGIYHVSCAGDKVSRAQMANKVLDIYKASGLPREIDALKEEPCQDPNFPRRLVLDTQYTQKELGINGFTDVNTALHVHVVRAKNIK